MNKSEVSPVRVGLVTSLGVFVRLHPEVIDSGIMLIHPNTHLYEGEVDPELEEEPTKSYSGLLFNSATVEGADFRVSYCYLDEEYTILDTVVIEVPDAGGHVYFEGELDLYDHLEIIESVEIIFQNYDNVIEEGIIPKKRPHLRLVKG